MPNQKRPKKLRIAKLSSQNPDYTVFQQRLRDILGSWDRGYIDFNAPFTGTRLYGGLPKEVQPTYMRCPKQTASRLKNLIERLVCVERVTQKMMRA